MGFKKKIMFGKGISFRLKSEALTGFPSISGELPPIWQQTEGVGDIRVIHIPKQKISPYILPNFFKSISENKKEVIEKPKKQKKIKEEKNKANDDISADKNKEVAQLNEKSYKLIGEGRYNEALWCCSNALKLNPKSAVAWFNQGMALEQLGKDTASNECFNKARKLNSKSFLIWDKRGIVLRRPFMYEIAPVPKGKVLTGVEMVGLGIISNETLKDYNNVFTQNPEESWYNKGLALQGLGKYKEAIECYDNALKLYPHYDEALCNKGVSLGQLGKYKEALECCNKALKINPQYDEAWYNKGIALQKLGRDKEALHCFKQAESYRSN